jgi:apolipoprotein N-acyltransferase
LIGKGLGLGCLARGALLMSAMVGSALLMAVAVGTGGHPLLACVALLPFFYCIKTCRPLAAAGAGAVWGASLYVCATLGETFAVTPSLFSMSMMSAIPATYAGLGALVTRRIGFSPFILALGWVGVEFALTPLGLRHGLLAATQDGGTVLNVVGGFLGYVFVAFLVAYANALVLSLAFRVRLSIKLPSATGWSAAPKGWVRPSHERLIQSVFATGLQARAPPA